MALLATYSFVYTTWTGYDEAQHVDMVYGLQHGAGWPGPGEKTMMIGVTATSDDFDRGRYADMFIHGNRGGGAVPFAEIDPTPRAARPSFDELGGAATVTDGRLSNQMIQHPPLVYTVGAGLLDAIPGSENWAYDQQVYLLRGLNIAIMAPIPMLCWAAARRFGLGVRLSQAAAVFPLAIPGMTRVGATFNNDGLLILATGGLTVVLAGVMRGDRRPRTAAAVGLWLALAMNAKGLALALPVMVLAAYGVCWAAGGRSAPWRPALLSVGLGTGLGIGFYVRNIVLYGSAQPNGWATNPPRREALLLPDSYFTWFQYFFRVMIDRFWSGLGLFEPPSLTPVAVIAASVVVTTAVIAGVVGRPRLVPPRLVPPRLAPARLAPGSTAAAGRRARLRGLAGGGAAAVLLLPLVLTYLTVGQRSWTEYQHYTRGIAVQGRYLYLGVVGLAVVATAGGARLLRGRDRLAVPLVVAMALVMQALALLAVCSYYWLPRATSFTPARIDDVVDSVGRWAPFPSGVVVAVFAGTALLAVVAVVAAVRGSAADGPVDTEPAKLAEPAGQAERAEPAEHAEPAGNAEPAEHAGQAEHAEPAEPAKPAEREAGESAEPAEPAAAPALPVPSAAADPELAPAG